MDQSFTSKLTTIAATSVHTSMSTLGEKPHHRRLTELWNRRSTEFANFERWDINFSKMAPAENSVLHGNYARSALKLGLELEAKLGANPYRPDRRQ